jgi:hypothetical protein
MRRLVVTAALAIFAYSLIARPVSSEPTRGEKMDIHVDEIGKTVTLIGRLGVPLGQECRIRGKWSIPTGPVKDDSPRFTVLELDGKQLQRPLEFALGQMNVMNAEHKSVLPGYKTWNALDGQEWKLIAYEQGRVRINNDFPGGRRGLMAMPYYIRPFTSELTAVVTSN